MDSSGQRVLQVVNDCRYPMEILPPALTVTEKPAIDYASLSHLISGGGANAVTTMRFDCNESGDIMSAVACYGNGRDR